MGYFWAVDALGALFVVLLESGLWYCAGVENPIDLDPRQIVAPCQPPENPSSDRLKYGALAHVAAPASFTAH